MMEQIIQYLPFLIPLVIAQYILAIAALIHVIRHPKYRFGNKIMWILIVLLIQIIGPVVYFAFGQDPDRDDESDGSDVSGGRDISSGRDD